MRSILLFIGAGAVIGVLLSLALPAVAQPPSDHPESHLHGTSPYVVPDHAGFFVYPEDRFHSGHGIYRDPGPTRFWFDPDRQRERPAIIQRDPGTAIVQPPTRPLQTDPPTTPPDRRVDPRTDPRADPRVDPSAPVHDPRTDRHVHHDGVHDRYHPRPGHRDDVHVHPDRRIDRDPTVNERKKAERKIRIGDKPLIGETHREKIERRAALLEERRDRFVDRMLYRNR